MRLLAAIAIKHLLARKRQSLVSLSGIVLGVAFFLAISSLMQGSEKDFIRRLVDNTPHITISDEFRTARKQPVYEQFPDALVGLSNVKPLTETRGLRGYQRILDTLHTFPGLRASPVLAGQALVSFAGDEEGITLNGVVPEEINDVTSIQEHMVKGKASSLIGNSDGIIIGEGLARQLSLDMGDVITVASGGGQVRALKIAGIFRIGRSSYDRNQTFVDLKRAQALLSRSDRVNTLIVKLDDPYAARDVAHQIEQRIGYKSVSWQEASEDLMNTLTIRNTIMYTVVSAVLVVAAFGIYNIISTVVMEKHRDIAILKSMGFHASDIKYIFVTQGVVLGIAGCLAGLPLGSLLMVALMQIRMKPPGSSEIVSMPIDWSWMQFALAAGFALSAAVIAALLPARKGAALHPVDILRGGT